MVTLPLWLLCAIVVAAELFGGLVGGWAVLRSVKLRLHAGLGL